VRRAVGRIRVDLDGPGSVELSFDVGEGEGDLVGRLLSAITGQMVPLGGEAVLELEPADVVGSFGEQLEDLDEDTCRVCGCTNDRACEPTCWWVTDPTGLGMLCSSCAAVEATAAPAAPADDVVLGYHPAEGSNRERIVDALRAAGGAVEDPSGSATRKLVELAGLQGISHSGIAKLMRVMEADRQITRERTATSTRRIALVPQLAAVPDVAPDPAPHREPPSDEVIARRRAAATEAMWES
jgi:hypothetical protein